MIRVENLFLNAGNFQLGPLNLHIKGSEYFVIVGPTGSGKTMLLELISGIKKPDDGKIFFNEEDITTVPPERRNIGYVTQQNLLFPHLSVRSNIGFSMRIRGIDRKTINTRIQELAQLVGINHILNRRIQNLSGGEAQRVSLARAICVKPFALLLDEPLSALDVVSRRVLRDELKKLRQNLDIPVIHVTHDFEEAFFLADRIGIIHEGKIVQTGSPDEVFRKPANSFVARFVGIENVFRGRVKKVRDTEKISDTGFNAIFETGNLKFSVISDHEGDAFACLRADEILISLDTVRTSALNNFTGKVTDISDEGALLRITVNIGAPVLVLITRISAENLGIKTGSTVKVLFKASSVHIF